MSNDFDPFTTLLLARTVYFFADILPDWGRIDIDRDLSSFKIDMRPKKSNSAAPIVVAISVGDYFVSITSIVIPADLKHRGIGKNLIRNHYAATKAVGKRLEIYGMVDSFYSRMIARGALARPNESVEITDQTDLERRAYPRENIG